MTDLSKDVVWIFSLKNPMSLPSYIVSGIMPADYNKIQKIIFLKKNDPRELLEKTRPKILIIGKAFHSGIVDLVKEAKKLNIKIISVFDDWHFDNLQKNNFNYNLEIAKYSQCIIAKTPKALDIIYNNSQISGKVIPDCIRYKTLPCINKITIPYKLCWFGTHNNHDSLINAMDEISKSSYQIELKIITNRIENLKKIKQNIKKTISFKFIEWSLSMVENINESEIIFIPIINDKKSVVKSSNRIVDSLNMGRFVIMNDNIQFSEFKDFCYFGNINDGLEWIKNNETKAINMIVEGQKYVNKNYNLTKIGNAWKKLIQKI